MDVHPAVHFVSYDNGHVLHPTSEHAHECWCEPRVYWRVNNVGTLVQVVEHEDYTVGVSREEQLAAQARGIPQEHAWINHALYAPHDYPSATYRDIKAREKGTDL